MMKSLTLLCPICTNEVRVSLFEETETGDFGTVLARWLEMDSDPATIESEGDCTCDFSKPLAEVWADYINAGRLDDIIYSSSHELEMTAPDFEAMIEEVMSLKTREDAREFLRRFFELDVAGEITNDQSTEDDPRTTPATA